MITQLVSRSKNIIQNYSRRPESKRKRICNDYLTRIFVVWCREVSYVYVINHKHIRRVNWLASLCIESFVYITFKRRGGRREGREAVFLTKFRKTLISASLILDFTRNLTHRLDHNMCKYQQWYILSERGEWTWN